MTPPLLIAMGAAAGLVVGSYVTTAALRAARGEQSVFGRSHCDACGAVLRFDQTLPVISFAMAGGACRSCRSRIDPLHPAGELAGAAIGVAVAAASPGSQTLLIGALALLLMAASVFDARTLRLPDALTLPIAATSLALSLLRGGTAVLTGATAALFAFALLAGLRTVRARDGRDPGLGLGDVKLICALALWLGALTPWMVVAAAVLGLASQVGPRRAKGRFAFGPMIATAGLGLGLVREAGWWPASM